MKRYLIIGVSLRSKGGEAMVLETCRKIKEINKNNHIGIFVPDYEYNVNFIKNRFITDIDEVISTNQPLFSPNKYMNFILRLFFISVDFIRIIIGRKNNKSPIYHTKIINEFSKSDVILQIAGISFTDNFGTLSGFHWMITMLIAKFLGKQYFCLPQAFGPSKKRLMIFFAKIGLNTVTHIMPRGKISLKFVKNLHLKHNNVTFIPDLAFSYKNPGLSDDTDIYKRYNIYNEKKYIALIFNSHLYNWIGKSIIDLISEEIDDLIVKYGYNVLLIAHEVNEGGQIDDRYINRLIYEKCINKENLLLINDDLRANELKSLIKICEFTICARFHGMISSLKVGVVPVIIGWADKYLEIMALFNLEFLVIDYHHIRKNELDEKIKYLLKNKDEMRQKICQKILQFENASELMKQIIIAHG